MKREDISAALSGIKTEYIEESEDYSIRKGHHWKGKTVLVAACLACVVGLTLYLPGLLPEMPEESGTANMAPESAPAPLVRLEERTPKGFSAVLLEEYSGHPTGTEVEVRFRSDLAVQEKEQEPGESVCLEGAELEQVGDALIFYVTAMKPMN